ncbi:hypothetical protein T4B_1567 [Trichinella pseudospiralis]|uniref:Uncharacterized protein n=1 Tax=Trichinella pseudospiralis TaxID=6337 RepID=A0A0V1GLJ0_TRIPS|nr:hypothetical protein T4B_1567 [Trichinella pseudospiralis]
MRATIVPSGEATTGVYDPTPRWSVDLQRAAAYPQTRRVKSFGSSSTTLWNRINSVNQKGSGFAFSHPPLLCLLQLQERK